MLGYLFGSLLLHIPQPWAAGAQHSWLVFANPPAHSLALWGQPDRARCALPQLWGARQPSRHNSVPGQQGKVKREQRSPRGSGCDKAQHKKCKTYAPFTKVIFLSASTKNQQLRGYTTQWSLNWGWKGKMFSLETSKGPLLPSQQSFKSLEGLPDLQHSLWQTLRSKICHFPAATVATSVLRK